MKRNIFLLAIIYFFGHQSIAQEIKLIVPNGVDLISRTLVDNQEKYLYIANDSKIVMWEIRTGKQLHSFQLEGETLGSKALSNDGKKIAIISSGGVYCFSTETGKILFSNKKGGASLIFSPDDKNIFVSAEIFGTGQEVVRKLNVQTGIEESTINCDLIGDGNPLFFIDNNTKLVVSSSYNSWCIVDINSATSTIIKTDQIHEKLKVKSSIPAKGWMFLFQNHEPAILCDIKTGKTIKVLATNSYDPDFLPSQDGSQFLFCADNGVNEKDRKLYLYNSSNMSPQKQIKANIRNLSTGYFSSSKRKAYFEGVGCDIEKDSVVQNFNGIICDYDGNFFGSVGYDKRNGHLDISADEKTHRRMDISRMKAIKFTRPNQKIDNVLFSPTADTLVIFNSLFHKIEIQRGTNNTTTKTTQAANFDNLSSEFRFFSSDGNFIFYADRNTIDDIHTLIKHDLKTGVKKPVLKIRGLFTTENNLYVNDDKTIIGGVDHEPAQEGAAFGLWSVAGGKRIFNKKVTNYDDAFIALSLDNKNVLTYDNNKFQYYNLANQQLISESKEVAFSRNGSLFAVALKNIAVSTDLGMIAGIPSFRSGALGIVALVKRNGEVIREFIAHDETVVKIMFSPDNKYLYTVSHDGTIKIWVVGSGELLGTLYLFKETIDYVFVTPDGRFDGTENGMKQLYYLKERNIISLDLVFEKYYTPNLYQRLLAGEKFNPIPDFEINPKPSAKIFYSESKRNLEVEEGVPAYVNTTGVAEITVSATAPEDKVDEIRLFHNGKAVNLATRGLFVTDNDGSDSKKYTIHLLPGNNSFRAIALNSQRTESDPDEIAVRYGKEDGVPTPTPNNNDVANIDLIDKNATLHLIVVGVNAYKGKINPLGYAVPDATAFKEELERDAKSIIAAVKSYFITDAKADRNGIINAFDEIVKSAKPQDVFVFYYAGHGYIHPDKKEFYLVSADVEDGNASLLKNGIPSKELQQYAVNIPAQKQLFILDACQSAGAFEKMLQHDGEQQKALAVVARSTGTHWMAASGSTETAKEFGELGHGVFTYSLLEALKGKAVKNRMITVNGLKDFLQVKVPELIKKYGGDSQYPASYGFGKDFPVEMVK